ncbi:MAG: hypothetical protein NVSMB9_28790 [Isosphaeraceae bacterium]
MVVDRVRTGPGRRAARETRDAFAHGLYTRADQHIQRWLQAEPASAEAFYYQSRVALALEKPEVFQASYRRAASLGCRPEHLALVRAIADVKRAQFRQAEPVLRHSLLESPGADPQRDEALARIYLEMFDLKRAAAALDRWARDAPHDPRPFLGRVEIYQRTDSAPEILIENYREALRRDPDHAQARLALAELLRSVHRNLEARDEFNVSLARHPDSPAGHLGAGRNERELGAEVTATEHFDRVLKLDPQNPEAYKENADIAFRRGNLTTALALLDRAVALDPEDVQIHYRRGLILARLGRADEATREHATARQLRVEIDRLHHIKARLLDNPDDLSLLTEVAQWMFDHRHEQAGADWTRTILQKHPDDFRANQLMAHYYDRQGNKGLSNYYLLKSSTAATREPLSNRVQPASSR